jgi:hypothetical protein
MTERTLSIHAMPRESFLRGWWRGLKSACRSNLFAARTPETTPERRLRLARAGEEMAEYILRYTEDERCQVLARALELTAIEVADLAALAPAPFRS